MRKISTGVLVVAAVASFPLTAAAQMKWTDKAVVSVNGGVQAGSHTLDTNQTFTLYDEPGSLNSSQKVGGGGFFDIGGGYKVWRNLLVGLDYSHSSSKDDASFTASVPDPLVSDRPRTVTGTIAGSAYKEDAIHFTGTWMIPVTDKIDAGLVFGPSIFMIKQDIPSQISAAEPPTAANVSSTAVKKTTAGLNLGVDVTYLFTKKIGGGVLARYTWGSADIDSASDSLTVGGFQLGFGIRYRF
jgi:Outer membrane protein beta-barrel domain